MKIKCKHNNIHAIKDPAILNRIKRYILYSDGQLNLEIDKEYVVYGIVFRDNSPWYYICLDLDDESPTAYPSELFTVIDGRLSAYWTLSVIIHPNGDVMSSVVFEEWCNDTFFYERLVDGDPKAIAVFEKYRELINNE